MLTEPSINIEKPIKILLIENEWRMRKSLQEGLAADANLQIAAIAENGREALGYLKSQAIDLVIMDYELDDHGLWGVELTKRILDQFSHIKIIFWSAYIRDLDLDRAKEAGASGYIPKTKPDEVLIQAIYKVMSGKVEWISLKDEEVIGRYIKLTRKEIQVMELLAEGKSHGQIAYSFLQAEYKESLRKYGKEKALEIYGDFDQYMHEVPEEKGKMIRTQSRLKGRTRVVEAEIANIKEKLGINKLGELIRMAIDEYLPLEKKRRPFTEEELIVMEKLLVEGMAAEQIAEEYSISKHQVEDIRKKFGVA